MRYLYPLIAALSAALFLCPAAVYAEAMSKERFSFDLTWRQKPRTTLKVWGTMKGQKSCKQLKATLFFDNTRKKNIAVSTDVIMKNYRKNSTVEISEVIKVKGTSKTDRYWVLNDIAIECEN